jgi:hypothetical protein
VTSGTTFRSEARNAEAIASFLLALPEALIDVGAPDDWIGCYGYGCGIHSDLWYKPMSLKSRHLGAFLSQSTEREIFRAGWSDMNLETVDGRLSIEISHEGFVRLGGSDQTIVQSLERHSALTSVLLAGPKA